MVLLDNLCLFSVRLILQVSGMSQHFEQIQSVPAYAQVADAIEKKIMDGTFSVGETIGTETELAEQFGVNRSTIREGIRYLEQSGLLKRNTSRRLVVSLPQYSRLVSRVNRALILNRTTFREIWEASLAIEPATVEMAAGRLSLEDLEILEGNLSEAEALRKNADRQFELDTEFHVLVAKAAKNRVIQLSREPSSLLYGAILKQIQKHVPQAIDRNIEAHRKIFKAFSTGDAREARKWMEVHLQDWRRGFEMAGFDLDDPISNLSKLNSQDAAE